MTENIKGIDWKALSQDSDFIGQSDVNRLMQLL